MSAQLNQLLKIGWWLVIQAELQTCGGASNVSGRCADGLQCLKTCRKFSHPVPIKKKISRPVSIEIRLFQFLAKLSETMVDHASSHSSSFVLTWWISSMWWSWSITRYNQIRHIICCIFCATFPNISDIITIARYEDAYGNWTYNTCTTKDSDSGQPWSILSSYQHDNLQHHRSNHYQ